MSNELEKAARDAVEAADNSEMVRQVATILAAQQLLAQQQAPACQHQAPRPSANAGKWAAVAVAGSVAAISLALSAIAVAVGAVAVTCCLLVLRGLWADFQKNR